ncbi:MAG: N-6 DNA methylase [bacterium]
MAIPKEITRLLERFAQQRESYQSGQYKEIPIRVEFIDPFFKALGWDVHNELGYAEAYKDVIHEDALKIGVATEAPDSCFRIGGARKFFVECKKPSVNIKDSPHPAYQLRRYGWSAKLPLSILTDFEEFAVYDCRIKPSKNDSSAVGRVLYLTCEQYAEKWDDIAAIFSRDAVLKGSFDKFAESSKGKRGTATVDNAFLEEIERWRDLLARNIAMRNPKLTQRELNFSVQRTIDRIIFLRICEDRGIEPYGRLMTLQNGERVYPRLCEFFQRADERYNSGLFHFQGEKGRPELPDELSLSLNLDDKVLKDIFANLYYPDSPYEFSVLSADILGQVYERFLGNVIRLTEGHQAKVEKKPEVRNAGGVFYTPDFITKSIVRQTIGAQIEGKTPRQVAKLRFCDMACGSGSFLIEAFQFLLDWHRDYYVKDGPEKNGKFLYRVGTDYRLTTDERKRILLNNIYGVDIDSQAVEVTKLSLLLKVLEGESKESITKQFELFHQRALPDLGSNIKCGNSLIGSEAYRYQQLSLLPEEERYRINVFDWQQAFPEVFGKGDGGFDAIIGNPPYIRIQVMKEWAPVEVELYKTLYRSAAAGNYDIYVVFVEKALNLLNKTGRLGFILPHKFFNAQYGEALRGLIADGKHLAHVVHFGDQQIFIGATTYTCLLFLDKKGVEECHFVKVNDLNAWKLELLEPLDVAVDVQPQAENIREAAAVYHVRRQKTNAKTTEGRIPTRLITKAEWNFAVGAGANVLNTLSKCPLKLGDIADLFVGLQTDADDVFILEEIRRQKGQILCASKYSGREHWFESSHLKPFLKGSLNIRRYHFSDVSKLLIFPYETRDGKSVLIPAVEYAARYPLTWAYLIECRSRLSSRNKGRVGAEWYGYVYKKNHVRMNTTKLLVPSIARGGCFAPDLEGRYYFVGSGGGGGGGYGITLRGDAKVDYFCLLGILNSSLLSHYLRAISTPFRGGYIALNRQYIEQLPIVVPRERAAGTLRNLVEAILALHKEAAVAKSPHDKGALERQIHAATRQIDELVCELYGVEFTDIPVVPETAT